MERSEDIGLKVEHMVRNNELAYQIRLTFAVPSQLKVRDTCRTCYYRVNKLLDVKCRLCFRALLSSIPAAESAEWEYTK